MLIIILILFFIISWWQSRNWCRSKILNSCWSTISFTLVSSVIWCCLIFISCLSWLISISICSYCFSSISIYSRSLVLSCGRLNLLISMCNSPVKKRGWNGNSSNSRCHPLFTTFIQLKMFLYFHFNLLYITRNKQFDYRYYNTMMFNFFKGNFQILPKFSSNKIQTFNFKQK